MSKDFLIVNKKILPAYFDKVIEARNLLESHQVNTITEAVEKCGISRNTYYKYKNYIYEVDDEHNSKHAVISMILKDEAGALSSILETLSKYGANILTISQAIPINHKATVLMSLDIAKITTTLKELLNNLNNLSSVLDINLDAIE